MSAASVADPAIRARIREDFARYRRIWCPHTAVAAEVYARLPGERRTGRCWIVVATAHPAKFRETVEPLIGQPIPMPPALARLFDRPLTYAELDVDLQALRDALSRAHA